MAKIRIPRTFLIDHEERDLPTPQYVPWRGGFVVDTDDSNFAELISDAEHYANDGCDPSPGLKRAARALVNSVIKETAFIAATKGD